MCGIVGFITKNKRGLFHNHLSLFEEMLVCDSVRGNDSTGAFTVLNNNQVKIIKVATNPHYLFETKQWSKFKDTAVRSGHILVGHNRKATFGNISRENAHPFAEGNTVLVHNGTVSDHKKMADVEVDSHAICHQISSDGYKKTLSNLKGSYSLVWYDILTKKLYLARNNERPLVMVETQDYFAFASEGHMLGWLLRRNNISFEKMELTPENEIVSLSFGPFKVERELITIPQEVPSSVSLIPVPGVKGIFQKYYEAYPKDSEIILCPELCQADTTSEGRFKIKGMAYLPGKPIFNNAIAFLPSSYDEKDAEDLVTEQKLIGKVRTIVLTSQDQIVVYIGDIRTDTVLDLWNNTNISKTEWNYFVEHIKCSKCEKSLNKEDNQLTSITREASGYKVVCADCVMKNFDEMPIDFQEKVIQLRSTDHAQAL